MRGRHLAPFTNLEALDLVYCPVNDEGLRQMQGLTKLRKLLLRDAVISDEGLRSLSGLVNVEQLDLGGTRITDAGIAHLRGMTKLKKLNLQGTALTDVGIRHLANMTELEELNLYGTKVSNVGVEVLKDLKHLSVVDLRYTRVTRAGVDRLQASVPRCEVTFLDPSVRPGLPAGADRIVAGRGTGPWPNGCVRSAAMRSSRTAGCGRSRWPQTGVTDELLRNLEGLKHLRKLELRSTEIGNLGVQHLATLTSLEELDLDGATISDEGLAPLAGLTGLRELVALAHADYRCWPEASARPRAREAASVQFTRQRSRIGAPIGHRVPAGSRPGLYRCDRFRPGSPGVAGGAAAARSGGHGHRGQGTPDAGTHDGAHLPLAQLHADHRRGDAPTRRPSSTFRSWRSSAPGSPTRACPSSAASPSWWI